jgi:hypothetical protein
MEAENTETYTLKSSSGSMELEADARALVVRGRVALRPILVVICVLPVAAIAAYALFSRSTTGDSIVIGGGLLAYAAYILDCSKKVTMLRLTGEYVEVTESRFLTESHRRMKLQPNLEPSPESAHDEYEGFINFLRLKGERRSHLDLLKGHAAQDVAWVWAAINHWRRGGPHNMALHLTALARRK